MQKQQQNHSSVILSLQAEARKVLDRIIPADAHIILLDYPNTTNVGDSLIWLGEIAYLNSRGLKPSYVCDVENYDAIKIKKLIKKNSILLMHGGGNFGTVWEKIHNFRLQVLSDFPNIKIVQFPQTIHFDDEHKIKEMADAIRQQANYILLARSEKSYDFAKQNFETELHLLLGHLKGHLHNHDITIKVVVNEAVETKFAFTTQDKYNRLNEINPNLELLRKTFDLDI